MEIALNRELTREPVRKFVFREVEAEPSREANPALLQFLNDRKLRDAQRA